MPCGEFWGVEPMRRLAILLAAITILAALLGFTMSEMPILSLFGKVAAEIALIGLAMTGVGYAIEASNPPIDIEAVDVHPQDRQPSAADDRARVPAAAYGVPDHWQSRPEPVYFLQPPPQAASYFDASRGLFVPAAGKYSYSRFQANSSSGAPPGAKSPQTPRQSSGL
jgi:hypothetical protein